MYKRQCKFKCKSAGKMVIVFCLFAVVVSAQVLSPGRIIRRPTTTTIYQPPKFANSVVYYKFNEYTNSAGKIVDSSNCGTNIGTPAGCLWVNQQGTTSAYISIYSAGGTSNIVIGTQTNVVNASVLTVSCWVKLLSTFTSQTLLAKGHSSGNPPDFSYSLSFDGSTAGAMRFILNVGGTLRVVTSPALPIGWTHLAGTYDGTTVVLYTNAVSCGTPVTISGAIGLAADDKLSIGIYSDNVGHGQIVNVDNVYIVAGDYWAAGDVTNDFNSTKTSHGF